MSFSERELKDNYGFTDAEIASLTEIYQGYDRQLLELFYAYDKDRVALAQKRDKVLREQIEELKKSHLRDEDALQAQIDEDMKGAGVSLSDAIIEERREGP